MAAKIAVRDLLEDFGDARDIATIEDLLIEAHREQGGGQSQGGSGRAVGVAEFH